MQPCGAIIRRRYTRLGIIGRGYQKEVWLAVDNATGALFGVKQQVKLPATLPKEWSLDHRFMQAAYGEVSMLERLSAAAPVSAKRSAMHVLGHCWHTKVFAVELLAKMAYVADDRELVWCARVDMALSVLRALEMLHGQRVMHCDFKPDQLGFDQDGNAKIVDLDTVVSYAPHRLDLFGAKSCQASGAGARGAVPRRLATPPRACSAARSRRNACRAAQQSRARGTPRASCAGCRSLFNSDRS